VPVEGCLPIHRLACRAVAATPRSLCAIFVCEWVAGASTLPCAGWITFCTRMLVSPPPPLSLDFAFPFRGALSPQSAIGGGWLIGLRASFPTALMDAVQCIVSSLSCSSLSWLGLVTGRRAPASDSCSSEFSQPLSQGSSLVASFRSLQTRPEVGIANCSGALVPCPGPSGGTAWRL
jgi:hypothetical protein